MGKCEHGLTSKECYTCASPKHGKYDQLTQDLAMIARNAIDLIRNLEREKQELLEALKEMLAAWEEDPAHGYNSAYKARAVIAKAEGKA